MILEDKTKDELIEIIEDCLEFGKIYLCSKCGRVVMQQYACDYCVEIEEEELKCHQ